MDNLGSRKSGAEDKPIKSGGLENIGTISIKGDLTYLIVNTNKGQVKLEILSTSPDDSIAGVIFDNQDIVNKNWEGYKNTPEGVLQALTANGFNLEDKPVKDKITYERNDSGKLEKKINGAVSEITKQVSLAKSVEDNLSDGLEKNKTFVKKSKIIDNKRILVFERAKNVIDDIKTGEPDKGVVDMVAIQAAMKELETELTDPYAKLLYEKLGDTNKIILLDYLVDNGVSPDENNIIEMETISPANFNIVYFSENGYLMQIVNAEEVKNLITSDKALFNIIAPDGSVVEKNINFQQAQIKIQNLSDTYQQELVAGLNQSNFEQGQTVAEVDPWNEVFAKKEDTESEEFYKKREAEQAKKVEDLMTEYEAEPETDRKLVVPDHILAEQKAENEKKNISAFDTLYTDNPFDVLYNGSDEKKDDDQLLDTLYTETGGTKVVPAGLDAEQIKLLKKINVLNLSEAQKREMLSDIAKREPVVIEGQENVLESTPESDGQETETLPNVENKEYESSPLFNKFVLSKITSWSKDNLEPSLINENIDRQNVKAWDRRYITGIVSFSSVGYSTYLTNWKELKEDDVVQAKSEKAIYSLVGPNGVVTHQNLGYQEANNLLWSESEKYLTSLNQEFEENKEAIEKELGSIEGAEDNTNTTTVIEGYKLLEGVTSYAEKMGINPEDLEKNKEFSELNSAQQQFVLESLNRSSLHKIKVEANQNFLTEKENKKWYNLGFALNQKFHKQKHEVLAAKNIHEQGLEGYGEAELSWLISIVKNGPEIKLDEDGDLKSVDYLRVEGDITPERQALIDKYNDEAYYLSRASTSDEGYKEYVNDVKKAREALLANAENDYDGGAELVNKLIEAEKQLKLHQFLISDSENEKIIQGLVDNSLGSWQKFGMMLGGQSDKAKYAGIGMGARVLLRGEVATAVIGKSLSYAIGPVVASAMGGWRANSKARAGLREEAELSKIGIASNNKLVKSLNLAVGSQESDGKLVNVGLADKLESLIDKCNALTAKANELEQTKTSDQEAEFQKLKTEEMKSWERLMDRVEYTSQKMEGGLVSFGAPAERTKNYYRLLNAVEEAKTLVFNEKYILNYQNRFDKTKTSSRVTELTRSNKKIKNISDDQEFKNLNTALLSDKLTQEEKDELEIKKQKMVREWYKLDELNKLSVSDRLASFLNFKEDQRQSAEFKYLVKQTAAGAVMGATFAAVGAWIFEHTGLGNWTSSQLNNLKQFVGQAVDEAKNLLDVDQPVISSEASISAEEVVTGLDSNQGVEPELEVESPEVVTEVETPEVITPEVEVAEAITTPETVTPEAEKVVTPKVYSDEISSEQGKSNSVWRSLREIFKSNSQSLGYEGDINDTDALNRWAENQTANTIHNSGDVTDKVFEGNKVLLTQENGEFKVSVEAGEGEAPDYLETPAEEVASEVKEEAAAPVIEKIKPEILEDYNKGDLLDLEEKVVIPNQDSGVNKEVINSKLAEKASVAKLFNLKIENLAQDGKNYLYQEAGKGDMGFTLKDNGNIEINKFYDKAGKVIPTQFFEDIKGKVSADKFITKGGLDKVFVAWDKLSSNDKIVYESLQSFNQNKLAPEALINKISGTFNVVAKDVMIDVDNKNFVLGNREFKMDADGVRKLVKVLTRRFGA